ncbi:putative tubulin-tyrosine ligase protein [Phaeoacremonium minimum UCRPA7]|uniref:Putative tubulin-tyrosine ligase protein n=1 Tax=Phaeoacremonium minimum (strain UCR-PA7) TaxID=1286976 RepID=R8BWM6_PHAM7|nr:putative tubulin-tyrosine ligase protein [Phaeoacremonium minimum UCRPA7]EOO03735.1 putative tubulin-tyrosine ligase protein [Phaeoacremonium minimum UCRPA7]
MEFARNTYDAVTSKKAQRTLVNTVLIVASSTILFGLAAIAYLLFYHNFLPDQVTTVPVHLQYGYELNPYGVASLADKNLKDLQDYDITVTLNLPRSRPNLDRGNFMIALHLLEAAPSKIAAAITQPNPPGPSSAFEGKTVLYTSTRPAILPYTDPLVSLASRLLFLAYHIVFPASEKVTLVVPMVEKLRFREGGMMPTSLALDIQAGQSLQVYSVSVTITAQLYGLRWIMHKYWITSFFVFTTLFWLCEMGFMIAGWVALSMLFAGPSEQEKLKIEPDRTGGGGAVVKTEGNSKSGTDEDVPMTFPTSSRQPPLRYEPSVKEEPGAESSELANIAPAGGEADDEDDEEDEQGRWRGDSGIGTSYSDRDGSSLRRRSSRGRSS